MIVGISGRKESGKNTVGMFLMEHLDDAEMVNFGDELKDLCVVAYGAPHRSLHGTKAERNAIIPHLGMSGRFLMQRLASDLRRIWPDCLVHAWRRRVSVAVLGFDRPPVIVACDVRMPNEVAAIHALGGVVVRLNKRAELDIYSDHETETALDGVKAEGCRLKAEGAQDGVWFDLELGNEVLGVDQTNTLVLAWVRKQMRLRPEGVKAEAHERQVRHDPSEVQPCL